MGDGCVSGALVLLAGATPAVGFSNPGGALSVRADSTAALALGVQQVVEPSQRLRRGSGAVSVHTVTWHVVLPPGVLGIHVSSASGMFSVGGRAMTPLQIVSGSPGTFPLTFVMTEDGVVLPKLVVDV